MTEKQRNMFRYNFLSQAKKNKVNKLALLEFEKPTINRKRPVELMDNVEFKLKD